MKVMNNLLISMFVLFSGISVLKAQNQEEPIKPMAEFNVTTYDFGKIEFRKPAKAVFKVKNTSLVPLIITNVRPTCGCTIADYPKEPIRPGETGEIIATYNAGSMGPFTKTVYVTTNASDSQVTLLMKGEVIKTETPVQQEN